MQIPDLNGRGRPCLHGEAGAGLNRQNMRMQRLAKQIRGIRMFSELRELRSSGAIRRYRRHCRYPAEQFVGIVSYSEKYKRRKKRQNVRKE